MSEALGPTAHPRVPRAYDETHKRRGHRPSVVRGQDSHYFLELSVWAVAGAMVLILSPQDTGPSRLTTTGIIATLVTLLGVRLFWVLGGNRITAGGLWALATAVFGGFSGVYWTLQPQELPADTLLLATNFIFWTTVGMAFFWRPDAQAAGSSSRIQAAASVTNFGITLGTLVAAAAIPLWLFGGAQIAPSILQPASFVGLSLLTLSIALQGGRQLGAFKAVSALLVAGASAFLFSVTTFTGFGRLILVSLALVPTIALSRQASRRHIKAIIILSIWPAILIFAEMRRRFVAEEFGNYDNHGLGSIVSPLHDFARLLRAYANSGFQLGMGDSFWATLTVFVPRSVWDDKPIGFGSVLTRILDPELVQIDMSLAALAQGEWLYNFGLFGLVIMVPVIAFAVRLLDRNLERFDGARIQSKRRLMALFIGILLVSDIPNFVWVGTFGYFSRTLFRLIIAFTLMALLTKRDRDIGDCSDAAHN